jgi:hypothetical protein
MGTRPEPLKLTGANGVAIVSTEVDMCCLVTTLALLGPRAGILVWWLLQPARWSHAFDSFLWPLLGFVFLPWTTLMYVIVAGGGVSGFDWFWLGGALLLDVVMWSGGALGNRGRMPGYAR